VTRVRIYDLRTVRVRVWVDSLWFGFVVCGSGLRAVRVRVCGSSSDFRFAGSGLRFSDSGSSSSKSQASKPPTKLTRVCSSGSGLRFKLQAPHQTHSTKNQTLKLCNQNHNQTYSIKKITKITQSKSPPKKNTKLAQPTNHHQTHTIKNFSKLSRATKALHK